MLKYRSHNTAMAMNKYRKLRNDTSVRAVIDQTNQTSSQSDVETTREERYDKPGLSRSNEI
ncbi:12380_t:CDS:2 [Funneliformis geosporum]|uniref:12380_t:CDS:1 n=1 Tax=Funneliformis geosporum TaxID=1117311 RepID=A0A9W4SZ25_9GLOM|nr:12380_t:CDS:2 [Funneliformis geosporum]